MTEHAANPPAARAESLLLNARQVGALLSVSVATIWSWLASGFLAPPCLRRGHVTRWARADIVAFVEALRDRGARP